MQLVVIDLQATFAIKLNYQPSGPNLMYVVAPNLLRF